MRYSWMLSAILAGVLVATASATVASRIMMQEANWDLLDAQRERLRLLDQEQALQVEWVYRSGLNTVERRARTELSMTSPRPDQWRIREGDVGESP